jgi:hypothetical protein
MRIPDAVNLGTLCMHPVRKWPVVLEKLLFHLLENALFIFGKRHRQSPLRLEATRNEPGFT